MREGESSSVICIVRYDKQLFLTQLLHALAWRAGRETTEEQGLCADMATGWHPKKALRERATADWDFKSWTASTWIDSPPHLRKVEVMREGHRLMAPGAS